MAYESNYFWKAAPCCCFFLICTCLPASWGTLFIDTKCLPPKMSKIQTLFWFPTWKNVDKHHGEQRWRNCFGRIAWGNSCKHKRKRWNGIQLLITAVYYFSNFLCCFFFRQKQRRFVEVQLVITPQKGQTVRVRCNLFPLFEICVALWVVKILLFPSYSIYLQYLLVIAMSEKRPSFKSTSNLWSSGWQQ